MKLQERPLTRYTDTTFNGSKYDKFQFYVY